jgi:hypothetical protein
MERTVVTTTAPLGGENFNFRVFLVENRVLLTLRLQQLVSNRFFVAPLVLLTKSKTHTYVIVYQCLFCVPFYVASIVNPKMP